MVSRKSQHGKATMFPVVGVGASAGGLDAFKRLFSSMPKDPGMAFVLIQHLDPTRKSLTAELVGTYTLMPVVQAESGMDVEVNHVYVIPPNKYLTIRGHRLRLSPPAEPRNLRMAVDYFLRSLARDQGERGIGIVLSGTGTDGTLGLQEIKAAGGMTIVQAPETAQHDGMPRSAIAGRFADCIAPVEQMADVLLAYLRTALVVEPGVNELAKETSDSLSNVVALLRASTNFDFGGYKKATLRRRIQRRMGLKHATDMAAYVDFLHRDAEEVSALFKDLLLKVTSFFREPPAWQFLQETVIRSLVQNNHDDDTIRIWVPACATGEEAYSVAIAVIEELQAAGKNLRLQIFASDVDADSLEVARRGSYPETIAADVSPERLLRFFTRADHRYRVNKELRDSVVFARQNVVSDPPFSKLDLISCRNLLIYLERALQEKLIALLHFALVDNGILFLGAGEGIGPEKNLFEVRSKKWRVYHRLTPTRNEPSPFPILATPLVPVLAGGPPTEPNVKRLPALAEKLLLERYAPACVIIGRDLEIIYFHGLTDKYLAQPSGPPTNDVVVQARSGLRARLQSAIRESMRSGQRVVKAGVHVRRGSAYAGATITVEPLDVLDKMKGLLLVSFADDPETAPSVSGATDAVGDAATADTGLVSELEYELRTVQENLQHTVEDFRAGNEELMSVNEELQSSNEELETSKEELQSLNEELTTSNTQLETKIGELEATNNDLDNLLTSTSIATLFLDTDFCIRRFTPAAARLFSLIPSDTGRPIADIAPKFTDPALLSDAAAVLERRVSPKREVQGHDGRWYVRQALPYRTYDGRIEGVVITLSDVAAEALQEARLYAEAIVDTVREPLLVLDSDLSVISANRAFYSGFEVAEKDTVGHSLYALGNHEWDIPQLRTMLAEVVPRRRVLNDFEVTHEFSSLGTRIMLLNARVIVRGGGRPDLILLAIEDLTERRRIQSALQERESRERIEGEVRQRQVQIAHALRVSTIGELASGLAHELNQPLSTIANDVEACARFVRSGSSDDDKLLALLQDASGEAVRASEIVEHLRQFIEKGEPQFEQNDLTETVRHVPRLLAHELEQEQIALRLDLPSEPLPVRVDRIQIEQVLVNLMQNAIDAMRGAGVDGREIEVAARAVGGLAEVRVHDSGDGLSAESAARAFEPFFTTKSQGMGLGLGLSISRSIVEAHGGTIRMDPSLDGSRQGTTVCFTLPLDVPIPASRGRSK